MKNGKNYKFVTMFYTTQKDGSMTAFAVTRKDGKRLFSPCPEWEARKKIADMGLRIIESIY